MRAGQLIVTPGKMDEPNVLMVQSAAEAPVKVWQTVANCAGVKGCVIVL
jgi:hypothetical protein